MTEWDMTGESRGRKRRQPGTSLAWDGIFCWSYQSDFTNEIGKRCENDRVGSNGHPARRFLKLPSMAISPWAFDYFISEMTDCTQQQKTPPQARLVPGRRRFLPLFCSTISHSVKINFHVFFSKCMQLNTIKNARGC